MRIRKMFGPEARVKGKFDNVPVDISTMQERLGILERKVDMLEGLWIVRFALYMRGLWRKVWGTRRNQ